ncbi:unnamed protein product [Acanthocheilonema viteae]|uniref:Uncharacterized protein n=1 Tax=Acanthocheilonema viteae TaxID=6277 RepID=A0A498SNJ6_ACAVI|nr:unnamed protein product [Acanthocheilonema viteae]
MCIVTAISISSNGKCKKGGLYYYMQYQVANANGIIICSRVAETIVDLMAESGYDTDQFKNPFSWYRSAGQF